MNKAELTEAMASSAGISKPNAPLGVGADKVTKGVATLRMRAYRVVDGFLERTEDRRLGAEPSPFSGSADNEELDRVLYGDSGGRHTPFHNKYRPQYEACYGPGGSDSFSGEPEDCQGDHGSARRAAENGVDDDCNGDVDDQVGACGEVRDLTGHCDEHLEAALESRFSGDIGGGQFRIDSFFDIDYGDYRLRRRMADGCAGLLCDDGITCVDTIDQCPDETPAAATLDARTLTIVGVTRGNDEDANGIDDNNLNCGPGACDNGGTCIDAVDTDIAVCACPDGFEGERCEIVSDLESETTAPPRRITLAVELQAPATTAQPVGSRARRLGRRARPYDHKEQLGARYPDDGVGTGNTGPGSVLTLGAQLHARTGPMQRLTTLAQDVRKEVQDMKNEGRRLSAWPSPRSAMSVSTGGRARSLMNKAELIEAMASSAGISKARACGTGNGVANNPQTPVSSVAALAHTAVRTLKDLTAPRSRGNDDRISPSYTWTVRRRSTDASLGALEAVGPFCNGILCDDGSCIATTEECPQVSVALPATVNPNWDPASFKLLHLTGSDTGGIHVVGDADFVAGGPCGSCPTCFAGGCACPGELPCADADPLHANTRSGALFGDPDFDTAVAVVCKGDCTELRVGADGLVSAVDASGSTHTLRLGGGVGPSNGRARGLQSIGGGQFRVDSFFDVVYFNYASSDGGHGSIKDTALRGSSDCCGSTEMLSMDLSGPYGPPGSATGPGGNEDPYAAVVRRMRAAADSGQLAAALRAEGLTDVVSVRVIDLSAQVAGALSTGQATTIGADDNVLVLGNDALAKAAKKSTNNQRTQITFGTRDSVYTMGAGGGAFQESSVEAPVATGQAATQQTTVLAASGSGIGAGAVVGLVGAGAALAVIVMAVVAAVMRRRARRGKATVTSLELGAWADEVPTDAGGTGDEGNEEIDSDTDMRSPTVVDGAGRS